MIPVYSDTKIYVMCPANSATGGPEALHQLAFYLTQLGIGNVFMHYYPYKRTQPDPVNEVYKSYNIPHTRTLENSEANLLILPETHLDPIFSKQFSRMRKVIWWLSVTNYYFILEQKIQQAKKKKMFSWLATPASKCVPALSTLKALPIYHIAHSHFSEVNLLENGIIPQGRISDYMNKAFFNKAADTVPKEDIIIYNPKKNGDFLQKIISQTSDLCWQPLSGLSPDEVADYMRRSKLYIDFGTHPGKERMPREACIMKCCLIIGKEGSARFEEDMPIPEKYRFEKSDDLIPEISSEIRSCLNEYELKRKDFRAYREVLLNEEVVFVSDIKSVFYKSN